MRVGLTLTTVVAGVVSLSGCGGSGGIEDAKAACEAWRDADAPITSVEEAADGDLLQAQTDGRQEAVDFAASAARNDDAWQRLYEGMDAAQIYQPVVDESLIDAGLGGMPGGEEDRNAYRDAASECRKIETPLR